MNDKELQKDIIDELDFEPSVDSAGIGVAVENGVVTLTGHVPSFWQKYAVERAVWAVNGVKAIAEEIQVRLPADKKCNDDEIARRAIDVLAWTASVPKDAVIVKVEGGRVTLSGQVNWNYQRAAAEAAVRKLSAVTAISNCIALAPDVQPADVKHRIMNALKRRSEREASRITVSVQEGGNICVAGEVDNREERLAVRHAAWSAPGVHSVEDNLRII